MGFSLALLFGFVPAIFNAALIHWVDRYEKEPFRFVVGVFVWGAVVAAAGAFVINSVFEIGIIFLTASEAAADLTTGSLIAPVIEESLKGAAVLIVYWWAHNEFDSTLDGIVYAAITALGFAATENVYYIYSLGYLQDGMSGLFLLAFVRVILVGWQHPFYTAFIGIGLAKARLSRSPWIKVTAVTAGWLVAIFMHSLHNTLASLVTSGIGFWVTSFVDWSGWLAMLLFILWIIRRENRLIARYLEEEVAFGVLYPQQLATALSPARRFRARLAALGRRSYRDTTRFYQVCGELCHKKHQFQTMGDEDGNQKTIAALRAELQRLSAMAYA